MQNGSQLCEAHVKTHAKYFPAIEIPVKNHANERIWPQDPEDAPEWGNPRPGAPEAIRYQK